MRPRRLKVEFYDQEGVRHSIAIDGPVTKEKVARILDLVELMSGTPQASAAALGLSPRKFDRLASTIISQLKGRTFTSSEKDVRDYLWRKDTFEHGVHLSNKANRSRSP